MPGILPMKVIKVGNSSQSRIAQACDRCRSKKIRCDGVRPCCSQCANVGFECKTSDKLSRRAFPRGYTESLEERVRALETEVKDLKGLLDEKDEKIDVLSRIHSFSPPASQHKSSTSSSERSPLSSETVKSTPPSSDGADGVIRIPQSTSQSAGSSSDVQCPGLSTTHGFLDTFTGRLSSSVSTQTLTAPAPAISHAPANRSPKTPPRLVSDQLINIFFQEWAPLYPVVHRPTVLKAYERYLTSADGLQDSPHDLVQLNLIFGIAALSSTARTNQDPAFFEANWSTKLDSLSSDVSMRTLQCLVLAQIYCMTKANYPSLLRYRVLAVGLCHQLRLHQSQKQFSNPLVGEMRKKVFWTQYTLDRLSAALTGLPALLRDEDIRTEYPEDVDDENVTETGFLPTLPGESTRLSSAIALFGVSRILSEALEGLYPAESGYEVYLSKMRAVSSQLDDWVKNLPPHLRLEFSQDKPSTNVTSSRSPLLSLVYYYIRSLIHRPAVCFAEEQLSSPSVLAVSDSSKHIIQILQLLDERRLSLSLSLNRKELVLNCGLGLLWQNLGLKRDSKLLKEGQKLLTVVIDQLEAESASAATEFSGMAKLLVSLDGNGHSSTFGTQDMSAPKRRSSKPSNKKQLQASPTRTPTSKAEPVSRRATITGASPSSHNLMRSPSGNSVHSLPSDQYQGLHQHSNDQVYYSASSLGSDTSRGRDMSCSAPSDVSTGAITMADWEYVLSDMDRGYSNIFNGIYGGKECGEDNGPFASLTADYAQDPDPVTIPVTQSELADLSPETWSASSGDIPSKPELSTHGLPGFSEDNMPFGDLSSQSDDHSGILDPFHGLTIPTVDEDIEDYKFPDPWGRRLAV